MIRKWFRWSQITLAFLPLLLTNCGKSTSPAPTVTITASPASISMGQSSMLTVTAANATQVAITDNVDSTTYSLSASGGTQSVTPPSTAIYKATATGVNGATAQVTTTIDVIQPPPTVTLSASPAAVFDGQGSVLTWTSTNATSVVLDNGIGSVPLNGSATVRPSQTTNYNITATGNGQQATASATIAISPVNSFDGLAEDSPDQTDDIDPIGAVGTKQFLEYDNTEYQGYDKITHAPVWSSPQQIGTPWNGIQQCEGTSIQLDAVVLFDRMASRWVIGAKTTRQQPYYFCIAISNTDDLSSSSFKWFAYLFNLDPVLGTNSSGSYYRPDWPKIGTWWNAYYTTMDLNDPDNAFQQSGIVACAFDRTGMLAGASQSALKAMQCFKDTSLMSNGVYIGHSLIPADFDGPTAPPAGRDEFMVSIQNPPLDGTSTTSSVFNLWDFHLDWTTPTNSKLTLTQPSVDAYTPGCYTLSFPAATTCVPEPPAGGIGQKIDSVGDRFMPRFAYRNFGSYESFLVAHTVQTNLGTGQDATQTGIRWYELQGNGSGVDIPAVIHQGTITPDNNYFRFLPSIAEDNVGNAAVGYSVSNPSTNPAIDFSYWNLPNSTDPGEVTIYQGSGEEVSSGNGQGKWGSYSSMTVDPVDDCTFWYVNEYWPTDTAWSTRIAYFKVPGCQ
jgi:hypothetical protein